jgi:hypothetical protein
MENEKIRNFRLLISKVLNRRHEYFFRIICQEFKETVWISLPKDGKLPKRTSKEYEKISSDCWHKLHDSINAFTLSTMSGSTEFIDMYHCKAVFANESFIHTKFGTHEGRMHAAEYTDCVMKVDREEEIFFFFDIINNLC